MPTFDQARDEILGRFKAQWDADTPAVNGGAVPKVFWEGVGEVLDKPHDAAYAAPVIRHGPSEQASLAGDGALRRFEKRGIIIVSIFSPLSGGKGLVLSEALAKVAKRAFEGKETPSHVWFRNATINEVGVSGPWYQMNVIAEFVYDELA